MSETAKHFVDAQGNYLGAWDGYHRTVAILDDDGNETGETQQLFVEPEYPAGAIEMSGPPPSGDGRQKADPATGQWLALEVIEPIPDSVSPRQFRLQLRKPVLPNYPAGIRDIVLAFVGQQSPDVQDAFEYSLEFKRDDAVMQSGFAALGFTEEQQDAFWLAASKI